MVFSSIPFLLYFFPVFFTLYFIAPNRFKNFVLLFGSVFFYAWGAPRFIFAILSTTFVDFHFVKALYHSSSTRRRKIFLLLSLSLNLGMLFYFKYCNFFVDNLNGILNLFGSSGVEWTKVILPIGISFYTFESITYVMDVYRGIHKPLYNFWEYQVYIICFPKLIAGPIVRYHEIADQVTDRSANDTIDNKLTGFYRFALGLAKKVIIANAMATKADQIFNMPIHQITTPLAWMGMLSYTFQIYFDFSGYSDMAIGMGKMLGFKFPENFNNPYTARSITEFWHRWHMTLSNWMRNYLYIPLGGNRVKTKFRLYFNLWFVFLASGLWHGAAWTFVIWGAYHGFFLVIERAFLLEKLKRWNKIFSTGYAFLVVAIGWILFRATRFDFALAFVRKLIPDSSGVHLVYFKQQFWVCFVLAVLFSFFTLHPFGQAIQNSIYTDSYSMRKHIAMSMVTVALLFLCITLISSTSFNPFIYFRF